MHGKLRNHGAKMGGSLHNFQRLEDRAPSQRDILRAFFGTAGALPFPLVLFFIGPTRRVEAFQPSS